MISRRDFVKQVSGIAAAASALQPLRTWAANDPGIAIPGKQDMIVRSYRFFDLETPVEYFQAWITPANHFFVRNHMHEPLSFDTDGWSLSVGGEVERPYSLTLAELEKLEQHTVVNTLECAGNGRSFHSPKVPGVQWARGAVGTGRFRGPRLHEVLQRAGIKPTGKHVMFRGRDEVPGKVPPFIRSIPIEKALDSDTLIALTLNGEPLPKHNGYPARALVPGWIGAASCKWLAEIKVLDQEFVGNFMNPGYRLPNQPVKPGETIKPEDTHPVTALGVKSIIVSPTEGAVSKSRSLRIHGAAWAGEADVQRVDISTDHGASWQPAKLAEEHAHYAWRLWSYEWKAPEAGDFVIQSRATDSQGRAQPPEAVWNPSGYLYNAIDQVKIHVAA
jgi:DMSO/TMAO reductase YedYZ molybdopterin-dependent catalytic subunit